MVAIVHSEGVVTKNKKNSSVDFQEHWRGMHLYFAHESGFKQSTIFLQMHTQAKRKSVLSINSAL